MRRIRIFVNATSYLVAVVITVAVGVRLIRQIATGDPPAVSERSAGFRAYQESRAAKSRKDWELLSQLADGTSSDWSTQKQDQVLNGITAWLDEGVSFEIYFRRLTNDQIAQMQTNLFWLARRWLEQRVLEYSKANDWQRRQIAQQDTQRVIGLALMFGRLDGPFGTGLNRGLNTMEEIRDLLLSGDSVLSDGEHPRGYRQALGSYFQAIVNNVNQWRQEGGWQVLQNRSTEH